MAPFIADAASSAGATNSRTRSTRPPSRACRRARPRRSRARRGRRAARRTRRRRSARRRASTQVPLDQPRASGACGTACEARSARAPSRLLIDAASVSQARIARPPRHDGMRAGRRRAPAASGASTLPVARPRESATPCQSGVTHASGSTRSGSCSTGKNVPEKRNSGTSTKRKIATSHWSSSVPERDRGECGGEREPAEQGRERRQRRER